MKRYLYGCVLFLNMQIASDLYLVHATHDDINELIEQGVNIKELADEQDVNLLSIAVKLESYDLVNDLLDMGFDVNQGNGEALFVAFEYQKITDCTFAGRKGVCAYS